MTMEAIRNMYTTYMAYKKKTKEKEIPMDTKSLETKQATGSGITLP